MEAIGEEWKDCLSFLAAYGAALLASCPKDCRVLVTPFHLLLWNMPLSTLLNIPPSIYHSTWIFPTGSSFSAPIAPGPSAPSKWQHPSPIQTVFPPQSEATPRVAPEEPSHSKRRDEMPLHKALTGGQQEAFTRDSELVQKTREEHYKINCPHFDLQTSCNLMSIFQNMITSADLLGSQIYKIQESWEAQSELQYGNVALRASPKGLQIFHAISPSESSKVMGLAGVHNLNALHHFNGMTFCPWCRKEGQNKETIVNHL